MLKNGVTIASKEEFCYNCVGFSMSDCPIETVKYIWVNIWCMLGWILSQNCRNTLPLHTEVEELEVQKLKTLLCPTNCFQPTPTPLLTRWMNIKIQVWLWFCIVWTVLTTKTTRHFHYYMYCLGKTTWSMRLVFPHFIMAAIVHVKCDVGFGRENAGFKLFYYFCI